MYNAIYTADIAHRQTQAASLLCIHRYAALISQQIELMEFWQVSVSLVSKVGPVKTITVTINLNSPIHAEWQGWKTDIFDQHAVQRVF